jgi:Zn-dependent protease with chaperone function
MFLPFIPYLIALAAVTALLALPQAAVVAAAEPWQLVVLYLALPLLGGLAGNLPDGWLSRRSRSGGVRRRTIFLVLWLWVLAMTAYPHALMNGLSFWAHAQEVVLTLLLVNYWLGDSLALHPYNPFHLASLSAQGRRLFFSLRLPLPILILLGLGLVLPVWGGFGGTDENGLAGWLTPWLSMAALLGLALVAVPLLIRVCWGLRPLGQPEVERIITDELRANGVTVNRVLRWPDELTGQATAGVIGVLPRIRYLLMSPALASLLAPEELRSVTAHEAGHLRHRHLWYFLAAVLSFMLLMQGLVMGVSLAGLLTGTTPPLWLLVGLEVVALLLFFRFGVGYLSRHFERQADGNAVRQAGPWPFEGALTKLAALNGIPAALDNWHHFGIARRVSYARAAGIEPGLLYRHDLRVRRIKAGVLLLLALGALVHLAAFSPAVTGYLGERYLAHRMDGVAAPTEDDLAALRFLASRAISRRDHREAERYFRLILDVTPEDPQAQNNLAWVLVTQPHPTPAVLHEGLALAKAAAHLSQHAYIWDTLAESYYRLGFYERAIEASSKALLLARAGEGKGEAPLKFYQERLALFSRRGKGI